jgi:membrane protease YdiL (CAAX protease family)
MRAFGLFVALFVMAGVIGACVAYPAYELTSTFAGWAFHRVAGRIAMLVLAGELAWFCRRMNLRTRADFGYGLPWRRFIGQSLLWGGVGMGTAGLGAAFLLGTGLRVPDAGFVPTAAAWSRLLLIGLSSGVAVALIEETVMRGAMHTAIQREAGPWAAALLTAPLFAALHFFAKVRIPPEELGWHSGFDLLLRSFAPLAHFSGVFDAFLSWLAVGLLLSTTRVLTGNIAVAIGLHAGWVVVLRMLQEGTVRGSTPAYAVWVGQFDGLLGLWLLPWAAAIGLTLWLTRRLWVPPAQVKGASSSSRSTGSSISR